MRTHKVIPVLTSAGKRFVGLIMIAGKAQACTLPTVDRNEASGDAWKVYLGSLDRAGMTAHG